MARREPYTEADWKLFRKRVADWQEACMERLDRQYVEMLTSDQSASERFWAVWDRIQKDTELLGVSCDMRRSQLTQNLLTLILEGTIGLEDLEGFSEGLREHITETVKIIRQ